MGMTLVHYAYCTNLTNKLTQYFRAKASGCWLLFRINQYYYWGQSR